MASATDNAQVKSRAWIAYLVAAVAATVAYYALGHNSYLFNLIGLSSPVLILLAVRLHRPERRAPWFLIAAGQFLFIAGDVVSYNYELFNLVFPQLFPLDFTYNPMGDVPFPGPADLLYLSVYPCLIAGVVMLIQARNPGRDRAGLLDSAMVAIGVGTVTWVLLIAPYLDIADLDMKIKLTAMAYPVMDLLLAAAAIRLAVGAGRRPVAFYLLMASIVALFATDAIYAWFGLYTESGYQPGSGWLEAGWISFYVLLGTAALHPSMRVLTERAPETEERLSLGRLVLLTVAALSPPVIRLVQLAREEDVDVGILSAASIVLFLLVVLRMAGLIRQQERSAERERALRKAGATLVTATSREGIHEAAIEAARALAGQDAAIRMCDQPDGTDDLVVVAAAGGTADVHDKRFSFSTLQEWKQQRLLENDAYVIKAYESTLREPLSLPEDDDGSVFVAPLFIKDELHGLMVVATPEEMPRSVSDALRALSSQVALALESATLTEDLLIKQSEARFASLVSNSSDVVCVIDPDTTVTYASPSAARVLGFEPSQIEGTRFSDLIHPDDMTTVLQFLSPVGDAEGHTGLVEFRIRCRDGHYVHTETLRTNLLHDPNVKGTVLNTRDVTERKQFEEQLAHQAFHDSVTSLANRALFHDRVSHALERQSREHEPISVLFMDLDDFKTINDSLGHAAGDQLLHEVGERLKGCLRTADTAARLGGDEFAILLEDGEEGVTAADVADRIMQLMEEPFTLEGKEVFVRASVGIATADGERAGDVEELLRNADVAMYIAKERGKGRYQVFEPAMHDTALKRLELKADLQRAIEHHEYQLHYQPVIELESGRITGVEALIRWIHPVRGLVPPLDFIPLAEETGLIVPIGRWVMAEACRHAVELQERFPSQPPLHMAVNLSVRQIARPELVDEVREILVDTGLDPHSLILEITESVMMQDMELSIERLGDLTRLGVQLAVDDFGTGYSSLNYIRRFPVDILKVDKSFIDGVNDGGEASALTEAVIKLAGILNLKPVAEGIERADQLQRLLELRCEMGQGFYFAKPLPSGELAALLEERAAMHGEAEALARGRRI
ncbi:MAG: putative bifunctional diguanylate cyclase/phosphodiesterase [Actinomycetota bacterium]